MGDLIHTSNVTGHFENIGVTITCQWAHLSSKVHWI
jgi:hypothetical protein